MESIVKDKSKRFAIRIVKLYQYLNEEKREFALSKQLLRSGTSVGANVREALQGQSKVDFTAKMSISLKEISEAEYWLELLYETGYLDDVQYASVATDCKELAKMLTSIVKTSRGNRN